MMGDISIFYRYTYRGIIDSERLFCKAGELISTTINRKKAKNVNMMLFLNKSR